MAEAVSNVLAELVDCTNLKTAVTGLLVGCEMHLTKSLVPISRDTVLADLTAEEADYTGYAAEAVTWSANTLDDTGRAELIGTAGEFRPTGSAVTNNVYNAWIENGAGDLILAWVIEDGPVPMGSTLDSYLATARLRPSLAGEVAEVT